MRKSKRVTITIPYNIPYTDEDTTRGGVVQYFDGIEAKWNLYIRPSSIVVRRDPEYIDPLGNSFKLCTTSDLCDTILGIYGYHTYG